MCTAPRAGLRPETPIIFGIVFSYFIKAPVAGNTACWSMCRKAKASWSLLQRGPSVNCLLAPQQFIYTNIQHDTLEPVSENIEAIFGVQRRET